MFCKKFVKARTERVRPATIATAGFSLIELLVVLAVISILATIVTPQVKHAMDNAKAQTCRNNLKQLHAAVLSFAADNSGKIPTAQTVETLNTKTGERYIEGESGSYAGIGWVAWVPKDKSYKADKLRSTYYKDTSSKQRQLQESHASDFRDDLGMGADARFAVENGALFDYVGDMSTYVCPLVRAKFAEDLEFAPDEDAATTSDSGNVYRTYAMNAYFRCSQFNPRSVTYTSKIGVKGDTGYRYGGHIPEPSKLLLFTEIQPSPEEPPTRNGPNDEARNGKWVHDGCINPTHWNSRSDNDEKIYAVHPSKKSKGATCALAVFYDGHIETVEPLLGNANVAWFLNRGWTPTDDPDTKIKNGEYDR